MQFNIGEVIVPIGSFMADTVNFLILAFILFIVITRLLGFVLKLRAQQAAAPPPPPPDVQLLTEIRDLLKAQQGGATAPASVAP
jgi:large conductance mechanosensitive channel